MTDDKELIESYEEAFRNICLLFNFDPSEGEGTSGQEVYKLVKSEFAALQIKRETLRDCIREVRGRMLKYGNDVYGIVRLCDLILKEHSMGEYILRAEHEAKIKGQYDALTKVFKEQLISRQEDRDLQS